MICAHDNCKVIYDDDAECPLCRSEERIADLEGQLDEAVVERHEVIDNGRSQADDDRVDFERDETRYL